METQMQIAQALIDQNRSRINGVKTIHLPKQACTLVTFDISERLNRLVWENTVRNAPANVPFVAIQREGNLVRAVRGIDDVEYWIDPRFGELLGRQPTSDPAPRKAAKPSRIQPKRRRRRA